MKLFSTVYKINLPETGINFVDLWNLLIDKVSVNIQLYQLIPKRRYGVIDLSTESFCDSSKTLKNFKIIKPEFFRDEQGSYYFSLSVGNIFTDSEECISIPNNELNTKYYKHKQWVRSVSSLSLSQKLSIINRFIDTLKSAGFDPVLLEGQEVNNFKLIFKNGAGSYEGSFPKTKTLLRNPFSFPDDWELRVICDESQFPEWRKKLITALNSLFPNGGARLRNIQHGRAEDLSYSGRIFGILVLTDKSFIDVDFKRKLLALESSGKRFRLMRDETIDNDWAIENILFDLFTIAGGIPWTIEKEKTINDEYIAIDAGHLPSENKSRWVSVNYSSERNSIKAYWTDAPLGEHLSENGYSKLLTSVDTKTDATIYRDGRFLRERNFVKETSSNDELSIYEVVKYPKVLLYRENNGRVEAARFGDYFRLPNGNYLLQTQHSNKEKDYHGPLKLISLHEDEINYESIHSFFSLCCMPLLSLTNMPRLPAPIYWADLISKLDETKWAKAIGRGFNLTYPKKRL